MQAFEQDEAGSGAAEEAGSGEVAGLTKRQRKNKRKRANWKAKRVGISTGGGQKEAAEQNLSLLAWGEGDLLGLQKITQSTRAAQVHLALLLR